MERDKMIRVVSAAIYRTQGYDDCESEIDLSEAVHPQEVQIHAQSVEIVDSLIQEMEYGSDKQSKHSRKIHEVGKEKRTSQRVGKRKHTGGHN